MSNATETIQNEIAKILSGNDIYNSYKGQYKYLLESYLGGDEYRKAGHLARYQTETAAEYDLRLRTTPLDNHCQSVVSVYTSFLFKEHPMRDLGSMADDPMMQDFWMDCDYEGRSLDHFMRDLSIWVSVFGHAWMIVSKPNIGATTRAEEVEAGVRPYLSMLTPMFITDWQWSRNSLGKYELSYLKYIEEINGDITTVKEWSREAVKTSVVNENANDIIEMTVEENQLGMIPAVICYNKRSSVRGIGVSDISDIADLQKFIYNAQSEVDQSIRLNTHPSLVKTPNTQAGIGAGALIHMDESMDPGLKPYLLEFNGTSVESIYKAVDQAIEAIDRIANTGAVRAKETKVMSGVSREVEFQMLNSRLASKAKSIELAEESMWRLWAAYMGYEYEGYIKYPMSYNIRDTYNDLEFYIKALAAGVPSKTYKKEIYKIIADLAVDNGEIYDDIAGEIDGFEQHPMYNPQTGETVIATTEAEHLALAAQGFIHPEQATVRTIDGLQN